MAVVRDATNQGSGSSPQTLSHTCTGSQLTLWIAASTLVQNSPTLAATYNGVAMTQVATIGTNGTVTAALFYLINPPTGAHNIVLTVTGGSGGSGNTAIISASFTGCDQITQPDASSSSGSMTTVTDKDWGITMGINALSATAQTAGTNSTIIGSHINLASNGDLALFDTNGHGSITPAGSFSMAITNSAAQIIAAIKQYVPSFNISDTSGSTDSFSLGFSMTTNETSGSVDSFNARNGWGNLPEHSTVWTEKIKS